MDEHNVHHFWGISPAIDFLQLLSEASTSSGGQAADQAAPLKLLQLASYDPRHTLTTICRATRHAALSDRPVHLYVHEEEPEVLARHLLLTAVLLDDSLLARERMETFLELHGNALLREKTAAYLESKARMLEELITSLSAATAAGGSGGAAAEPDSLQAALASLIDLSQLKFAERDALVECLKSWRQAAPHDMVKAWDTRSRHWYADRYDNRRNLIDWDYHMRLLDAGTPGQDPSNGAGCIIHYFHFRHWRAHGIAYELRDSVYNRSNRSLLSTAQGRTKEFKNRSGSDVGRSVTARGLWADILNSPYYSWGLVCEDPAFFKISNKQFTRTAVDVAEHNVAALLAELRTGRPVGLGGGGAGSSGSEPHRAKVARGPTSMEDLEAEAAKDASAAAAAAAGEERPPADGGAGAGAAAGSSAEPEAGYVMVDKADAAAVDAGAAAVASLSVAEQQQQGGSGAGASSAAAASSEAAAAGSGPEAAVAAAAAQGGGEVKGGERQEGAEEEKLRAIEAALDRAAWRRCAGRFRVILLSGDVAKSLTGKAKLAGSFDLLSIGHRHMHLAAPEAKLAALAKPGSGLLVAETAHYLLQLTKEQAKLFGGKLHELAAASGWVPHERGQQLLTPCHALFRRS